MGIPTNRIAVYLTSLAALATALAPVIADLDITSTVGIVGGVAAFTLVVRKWLEGWQQYEAMEFSAQSNLEPPVSDLNKYEDK